ncbi:hypothetical protein HDU82_004619 [Entophlyctis luteolus]|nr:hypothetical protein HDU82_004619 [Entophlyctis luteolus]
MVMEYCAGGEAFDHLCKIQRMSDTDPGTRRMFREIVEAVAYCHDMNFVHRDLKLENVLLTENHSVKIIDFGFTRPYTEKLLDTYCGSIGYAAPEMITGKKYSGPRADVWSLGVILYTLLCGYLPFDDDNEIIVHQKISCLDYELPDFISEDSKNLISQILQINPHDRISVANILTHPWFVDSHSSIPPSAPFSTMAEMAVCEAMVRLGLDAEGILESVCGDACDSASALWYLLVAKEMDRVGAAASGSYTSHQENSSDSRDIGNLKYSRTVLRAEMLLVEARRRMLQQRQVLQQQQQQQQQQLQQLQQVQQLKSGTDSPSASANSSSSSPSNSPSVTPRSRRTSVGILTAALLQNNTGTNSGANSGIMNEANILEGRPASAGILSSSGSRATKQSMLSASIRSGTKASSILGRRRVAEGVGGDLLATQMLGARIHITEEDEEQGGMDAEESSAGNSILTGRRRQVHSAGVLELTAVGSNSSVVAISGRDFRFGRGTRKKGGGGLGTKTGAPETGDGDGM